MSHVLELNGKRYLIRDREDWQVPSRPVTGPSPRPDLVHHAVIHWPGAGLNWLPPKTFAQTAAHLRWANDMYLNDPARGYSYGYGFVIGQTPVDWNAPVIELDLWEVRGTDIRIASNDGDNGWYGEVSDPNFNGRSISCQLTASVGHPATNDQIETARVWVAMMDRVYGERLNVIAHRVSDQTTCPGEHINAQIGRIADRPTAVVPPGKTTWVTPVARCYVRAGWGPWHVGAAVMADFAQVREANPGTWHPGDRVIVPGRVGAETAVRPGEGALAILRRFHDDGADTTVSRDGFAFRELGRFCAWNGGEGRVYRAGDIVFWPAP
jgi:hypothetical protein